ncbi:hypothetical protein F4805DRAFT_451533 [Annulohypoxylon moriforme]|nr:hypothetical protein F4805DRAFT_451533 [Annulohypoxylon moriforme]
MLFITHGFGSWIVKEVLASASSGNIACIPTRLVFVDEPTMGSNIEANSTNYRTYFQRIQDTFNIRSPKQWSEERLESCLRTIDDNFRIFLKHCGGSNPEDMEPLQPNEFIYVSAIWMMDNTDIIPLASNISSWSKLYQFFSLPSHYPHSQGRITKSLDIAKLLSRTFSYNSGNILFQRDIFNPDELPTRRSTRRSHRPQHSAGSDSIILSRRGRDAADQIPYHQRLYRSTSPRQNVPPPPDHTNVETISNASYVTAPQLDIEPQDEFTVITDLARSFQQRGEFESAENLFTRVDSLLSRMSGFEELKLRIRLQIASVRLYLGKDKDFKNEFGVIQQDIRDAGLEKETKAGLEFDARRLLARHMLYSGEWKTATEEFQRLLEHQASQFIIYRDLALSYAYLGDYSRAKENIDKARQDLNSSEGNPGIDNAETSNTPTPSRGNLGLEIKRNGVKATEAIIDMLYGNYQEALKAATECLQVMEKVLGPRHFKTLTIATLKVRCQVHEGRFTGEGESLADAESLCLSTFDMLAQGLGRRHYLTLEAMECLVRIFRTQARFAEAIDTGTSLYTNAIETLGRSHPQTIDINYQLAKAHLLNGDYHTSEILFISILEEAKSSLGDDHPKTLNYTCELARALLYQGRITKAFDLVIETIMKQIKLYNNQGLTVQKIMDLSSPQTLIGELEVSIKNALSFRIPPYLVSSLQLLAEIELRKRQTKGLGGDLELAQRILNLLVERVSIFSNGASVTKASIVFDLAVVLQAHSMGSDASKSIEKMKQVVQDREKLLGEDHVDTLRARHELTRITFFHKISTGKEEGIDESDLRKLKSISETILSSLESKYGSRHPQTLNSRLWCFMVSAIVNSLGRTEIEEEARSIVNILSDAQLVIERPVESILMKFKVVSFLHTDGDSPLLRELLESVGKQLKDIRAKSVDPPDALNGLEDAINEMTSSIRPESKNTSAPSTH